MNESDEIKKKIKNINDRLIMLENIIKKKTNKYMESEKNLDYLSKKVNASITLLKQIFEFEGDNIMLLKIPGVDTKKQIQESTLLILLAFKYYIKKEEILSTEIKKILSEHGIPLNNFATHLKEIIPLFIRTIGKKKSTNISYRLTIPGEVRAVEILKNSLERGEIYERR
ncbi:hypothetical protein COS64_02215 [archaeon CG06_land_8_20_14_3_00_37_11]|nr:MAG: hypothetical protein COS64_02215 [archaeon CG06_land_8_20_14_3_00_37_11]